MVTMNLTVMVCVWASSHPGVQSSDDPVAADRSGLHHRLSSRTQVHKDRHGSRQGADRPERRNHVHHVRYELHTNETSLFADSLKEGVGFGFSPK